jgi:hypothetical protein
MKPNYLILPELGGTPRKLSYTRLEAAGLLGISPNSLDRLVKRGLLSPSKALRRPLFSLLELNRFLEETR